MSDRADKILDILDAGLQHSAETGCPNYIPDGRCARCVTRDSAKGSDWCEPCRSYLLGDGPEPDPWLSGAEIDAGGYTRVLSEACFDVTFMAIDPGHYQLNNVRVLLDLDTSYRDSGT